MTRTDRLRSPLRRRTVMVLPVLGLGVGALASCSKEIDAPEGWVRHEKGFLSVAVPPELHDIAIPQDMQASAWDWVFQDKEDFYDPGAMVRLTAMTAGPSAVIGHPPAEAAEVARILGSLNLFGDSDLTYPKPRKVESGEDEVQRVDMPFGDGAGYDYLLVAKDADSGIMVVVGLTGPGVTEEIVTGVTAGIRVVVPE